MKRFIVCVLVSALMAGCGGNKKAAQDVILTVNDPGESLFPVNDFFRTEKRLSVKADGEYFLSDINDAFFSDDFAFILDQRQAVSKVDLKTGEIVSQLRQIGRGPKDYLDAMNLTGDDDHLYLLDMSGKSVHVYDFDLNHIDKYNIDFIPRPSSFTRTKDGFMFLNSFDDDSIGMFVVTDSQCRKIATYLPKEVTPAEEDDDDFMFMEIFIGKYFLPDLQGKVVCHNPKTDDLYLYDGKSLAKRCQVKMGDDFIGKPGSYIRKIFSLNGNTLVNYMCDKGSCYAYFDQNFNLIAEGSGKNDPEFFPMSQVGDRLMTVVVSKDLSASEQAQIIIYRTK